MKHSFLGVATIILSSVAIPAFAQTHSDVQILADVRNILTNEPVLQDKGNTINPSVRAGVVTLSGTVTSDAARVLASKDIADVPGIKTVLNDLTVGADGGTIPATSRPAPSAMPDTTRLMELHARSVIAIRLQDEIDSKTAKVGDEFHGTVASNVFQNGYPLIPVGTPVLGRVTEAKAAGRLVGFAVLSLELIAVRVPVPDKDPEDLSIVTAVLSSRTNGRGTGTAMAAGGGAGIGGLIGALGGGGKGAAIGAASGAALGTGARALQPGQQIELKSETLLQFTTNAPLSVPVRVHNGLPQLREAATGEPSLKPRTTAVASAPSSNEQP